MARTTCHTKFVLTNDDTATPLYFKSLQLGMFWECVTNVDEARKFDNFAAAAKVARVNGKSGRGGWRVVPVAAQ